MAMDLVRRVSVTRFLTNRKLELEIDIRALGMKGEVIVPSFTFIATAHALQWQGITLNVL